MNDISIDIQDMLTEGVHPTKIAKILSVPLSWVYDALEMMESSEPSFDPYETINS
jgi:hypothetical protein